MKRTFDEFSEEENSSSSSSLSALPIDVWRKHVWPKLNLVDKKFLHKANRFSRSLVVSCFKRDFAKGENDEESEEWEAMRELRERPVSLGDFSSIETLCFAWNKFPFGKSPFRQKVHFSRSVEYSRLAEGTRADFLEGVAKTGSVELVRWANEVAKCKKNKRVIGVACRSGHAELLKFVIEKKWPQSSRGGYAIVDFIFSPEDARKKCEKMLHWRNGSLFEVAAANGHVECLEVIREHGALLKDKVEFDDKSIELAAAMNHVHVVQYCMEQKFPVRADACALAAYNGNLDVLKCLHEHNAPWNESTCQFARNAKHFNCLEYAKENGCPDRQA
ncbi:unnamed protein product [Bathycoccus prasinos]